MSWDVYSEGFTGATVLRFHMRLADARTRHQLAELLGLKVGELDETLGDAYVRLRANQHGWERPPAQLFPASGE